MTVLEMLNQSAILTLLGMLVVFCFLIIMTAFMNVLRIIVHAAKLDKEEQNAEIAAPAAVPAADQNAVVAAIATALHEKK